MLSIVMVKADNMQKQGYYSQSWKLKKNKKESWKSKALIEVKNTSAGWTQPKTESVSSTAFNRNFLN